MLRPLKIKASSVLLYTHYAEIINLQLQIGALTCKKIDLKQAESYAICRGLPDKEVGKVDSLLATVMEFRLIVGTFA